MPGPGLSEGVVATSGTGVGGSALPPSPSRLPFRSRGALDVSAACEGSSRWWGRRASACVQGLAMQLWEFPSQRQGADPLERDQTRAEPSAAARGGCPAARLQQQNLPSSCTGGQEAAWARSMSDFLGSFFWDKHGLFAWEQHQAAQGVRLPAEYLSVLCGAIPAQLPRQC